MKLKLLVVALAFMLALPFSTNAAVDRAIVHSFGLGSGPGRQSVFARFFDGTTQVEFDTYDFDASTTTDSTIFAQKIVQRLQQRAADQGWTLTNGVVMPYVTAVDLTTAISGITQPQAMTFSSPTVVLGTGFLPSATRASDVSASFRIANVLNLSGGAAGDIIMEQADDSGFTTNVVELGRCGNGNTGTLVIGLALNDAIACQVSGITGSGKYVRYRSSTTVGTPTYTVLSARQVLLPSN